MLRVLIRCEGVQVLTPMQVATFIVHAYPRSPGAAPQWLGSGYSLQGIDRIQRGYADSMLPMFLLFAKYMLSIYVLHVMVAGGAQALQIIEGM